MSDPLPELMKGDYEADSGLAPPVYFIYHARALQKTTGSLNYPAAWNI
jgi:hypothetical protein